MKEAPGFSETRFLQEPHGVTTQKTPFFIVTAVKTSNLTNLIMLSPNFGPTAAFGFYNHFLPILTQNATAVRCPMFP
jgi:hypothetical protein